jgi:hypothetical protein
MYRELNRAIQGGEAGRLAELFGSREPFKIEWTFAATDLRTGAAVLVRIGPGGPGEIGAEITAGRFPGSVARVTFPDRAQDAYEVVATATVSDVYGLRGKDSFRLGSHAVLAREPDPVIQLAAGLAGVSEDLVARSRANEPVASPDPAGRRARIVRAVASAAVADGSVSIEELRTLVRVARRAGGQ